MPEDAAARHLVLVGMMGVGKTTVGKKVARKLGRRFLDADDQLEARTGRSVADWFATEGEAGFRAAESRLLAELLDEDDPLVIATGGGVVIAPENRVLLRQGLVVWLAAEPAFLVTRAKAKAHRPLIAGDDAAVVLERLATEREPWYREVADITIQVGPVYRVADKPKKSLAALVLDAVAEYGMLPVGGDAA